MPSFQIYVKSSKIMPYLQLVLHKSRFADNVICIEGAVQVKNYNLQLQNYIILPFLTEITNTFFPPCCLANRYYNWFVILFGTSWNYQFFVVMTYGQPKKSYPSIIINLMAINSTINQPPNWVSSLPREYFIISMDLKNIYLSFWQ